MTALPASRSAVRIKQESGCESLWGAAEGLFQSEHCIQGSARWAGPDSCVRADGLTTPESRDWKPPAGGRGDGEQRVTDT